MSCAISYLERQGQPRLAYCRRTGGQGEKPTVMFLHGFRSDMGGGKALYLEQQCAARSQPFIRFDVWGHGASGGAFEDGTISHWKQDALDVLDELTTGPVILVGSSMGGWLALLLGLARPERVAGIIGLAAAPDFTGKIAAQLTDAQRQELARDGLVRMPNNYDAEPYIFTQALLDDGAQNYLLQGPDPLVYACPVHLIQGKEDADVPWQTANIIRDKIRGGGIDVSFIDDGDHRLSRPEDLRLIDQTVCQMADL